MNRSLTLGNVVIEGRTGIAKLSNYALHYLTCNGKYVDFYVGEPAFSAPEVKHDLTWEKGMRFKSYLELEVGSWGNPTPKYRSFVLKAWFLIPTPSCSF